MKNVSILILTAFLIGCDYTPEEVAEWTTPKTDHIHTKCINGVEYYTLFKTSGYQGYGYMAVAYNTDGTIRTCEKL